jgi:dUTP pyrophosphatase
MEELEVYVTTRDGALLPGYATPASAGMDVRAHTERPVVLAPLERALIPTGISISLPEGYEGEVRPRSGLAVEFGVTVLNAPGTIDADYRGEIKVVLINLGNAPFEVRPGDRIAQIVFKRTVRASLHPVDHLPETERGAGGFGSTGRS